MKYIITIGLAIALFAAGVALYIYGIQYPLQIVLTILFGWIRFLARVIPEMTLDISATITVIVCLLLITVAMQRLCSWLYRHNQKPDGNGEAPPRRWRWRWTFALVAVIVLMFIAGTSAIGITHQTGWLITSPEPLIGRRSHAFVDKADNNLHLIALATHNYYDWRKCLPPGGTFDKDGNGLHSWQTLILPFVAYDTRKIDMKLPWNHPKNAPIFKNALPIYCYPDCDVIHNEQGYAVSHYASNVHLIGGSKSITIQKITDGTENTLLMGQVTDNLKPWGQPINWRDPALGINKSPRGFGNPARTGSLFVFADGHVKFLTNDVSPAVLKALSTPDRGD